MLFHLINVITAYRPNNLSKKIKKETKEIHDKIEKHPFFKDLISGNLSDLKYAIYLQNLYPIYKGVEMFLFKNTLSNDIIQSKKIEEDLRNYSQFLKTDIGTQEYKFNQDWLNSFFMKDNFFKKTELYVRWLADMYGGQIIKKNLRFVNKYKFDNVRASIQRIRKQIEEDLNESNVDKFIYEVKKTYSFHYQLVDKIYSLQ